VRVPSANASLQSPKFVTIKRRPPMRKKNSFRVLCNFVPRSIVVGDTIRVSREKLRSV
jgi:hypothetical protein